MWGLVSVAFDKLQNFYAYNPQYVVSMDGCKSLWHRDFFPYMLIYCGM